MVFNKEDIKEILAKEIKELYDVEIRDLNINLLNPRIGIPEGDFIYLFENLKKKYNINIYPILALSDSEVFTINRLAEKIVNLLSC